MGERVPVAAALSHANTLEVSWHSHMTVLLPPLESTKVKRYTSHRSYSTNVYIQNQWSTALKLPGTLHKLTLFSLQRWRERYKNIYLLKIYTTYGAKYCRYNGAQNKNQKPAKTCQPVCYRAPNNQKPSTIPSRKCNNCFGFANIWVTSKVLKLKNSNLSLTNF